MNSVIYPRYVKLIETALTSLSSNKYVFYFWHPHRPLSLSPSSSVPCRVCGFVLLTHMYMYRTHTHTSTHTHKHTHTSTHTHTPHTHTHIHTHTHTHKDKYTIVPVETSLVLEEVVMDIQQYLQWRDLGHATTDPKKGNRPLKDLTVTMAWLF